MARNNRDIDRQQKLDAIRAVARRLLLDQGYETTSMAQVAQAAGVAPNTLYWYFTNKDDLLIAVLNDLVAELLAAWAERRDAPLAEQLLWLIERFQDAHHLLTTVHTRVAQVEALRTWHENFHRWLDELAVAELVRRGLKAEDARVAATASTFIVEGLLSHPHTPAQRAQVVAWLSDRLGATHPPA